jgi:predicted RNA binding protein YcfA (HicA-like mRNA interferase family)
MATTWRDVFRVLERHGFVLVRSGKGSHFVYRHTESGIIVVVVGGKLNRVVAAGTLGAIRRQSGIGKEELP